MRRAAALVICFAVALSVGPSSVQAQESVGGSFTAPITVDPTKVGNVTVSGTLTAEVVQFRVGQDGRIVAIANVSGTLTATDPSLGTATVTINASRLVLNAQVQANCEGQRLHIDLRGVLQIDAQVTFTNPGGRTTTKTLTGTVPLRGSLDFTATTAEQAELICDIATLLRTRASVKAIIDKLNTLVGTL